MEAVSGTIVQQPDTISQYQAISEAVSDSAVHNFYKLVALFPEESNAISESNAKSADIYGIDIISLPDLVLKPGQELIIDTDNMTVTLDGQNAIHLLSDDSVFFFLAQGEDLVIQYASVQNEIIVEIAIPEIGAEWEFKKITFYTGKPISCISFFNMGQEDATMDIQAVKLEAGSISTLALDLMQPSDYAAELRKCQRYFQIIKNACFILSSIKQNDLYLGSQIDFPKMRIIPSVVAIRDSDGRYGVIEGEKFITDVYDIGLPGTKDNGLVLCGTKDEMAGLQIRINELWLSAEL